MVNSAEEASRRPFAATSTQRRLLWALLLVAWTAMSLAVWEFFQTHAAPRFPRVKLKPHGAFDAVEEIAGPVSVRLRRMGVVRLAGVSAPEEAAACDRAAAFLRRLLPGGAEVYLELEPRAQDDGTPPRATVYLVPEQAARTGPFPYAEARLVARAMVQEGLARVDADRPYRYQAEFLLLEDDARRHGRGLWGRPSP